MDKKTAQALDNWTRNVDRRAQEHMRLLAENSALKESAIEIPEDIAITILRALVWCGDRITLEQREKAWTWVLENRGNVEEMGT